MAQTVAVVRNTLTATGGGTTTFTRASFGTPSAAILFGSNANSTNNPAVFGNMIIGLWDGTGQAGGSVLTTDNVGTKIAHRSSSTTEGFNLVNGTGTGLTSGFTISSTTDGISLQLTDDGTSLTRFATALLIAGVSAKLITFTPNTSQDGTQASASIGFPPKLVFFLTLNQTAEGINADAQISFGFAEIGGVHRSIAWASDHAVAGADVANSLYSESRCVSAVLADAVDWALEVTTWGADTFTATTRDGGTGGEVCYALVLGGDDLSYDVGTLSTATSTGDQVNATDVTANALLMMFSTATGTTLHTDSGANGIGMGAADSVGQFAHCAQVEDGAGTSNCNSAAQAAAVLDLDSSASGTRTDLVDATVALNAADFTLNYSVVDATARKGWWVAFGAAGTPAGQGEFSSAASATLTLVGSSAASSAGIYLGATSTLTMVGSAAAIITSSDLSVASAIEAEFEAAGLFAVPVDIDVDFASGAIGSATWFSQIAPAVVVLDVHPVITSDITADSASTVTLEGAAGAAGATVAAASAAELTLEGAWVHSSVLESVTSPEVILFGQGISDGEGDIVFATLSSGMTMVGEAVEGAGGGVSAGAGAGAGTGDAKAGKRPALELAKVLKEEDEMAKQYIEKMAPIWVRMVREKRLAEMGITIPGGMNDDDRRS